MNSGISLIEFIGALTITGFSVRAFISIIRKDGAGNARRVVAEGVVVGLSFKLAASLLKLLSLGSWSAIGLFSVVFLLRTLIKTELNWQISKLELNRRSAV